MAVGLRGLRRGRRERGVAAAQRDARLRWVVLRHDDAVVLTNRGATAVADLRLSASADGCTVEDGARVLPDVVASVGPGAAARVAGPLTTETLWLGVEWTDPRYGELRAVLRTDVFRRATELLHRVKPDDLELVEERARQRRELRIGSTPVDGLVPLRGCLDVEAAELLRATLSRLAAPRPAEDGTRDRRSPAHRVADALVELVGMAADHACVPGEGYARPHVTVTVDAETLATGTGPLASMPFLGPLSAAAARRWA